MNEFDDRDHTIKPLMHSFVKVINESIYKEEATKANRLVTLDSRGRLPPVDGSQLINLPRDQEWVLALANEIIDRSEADALQAPLDSPNFSGNVGIGTTAPSTRLEVNGAITCTSLNITSYVDLGVSNLQSRNIGYQIGGTPPAGSGKDGDLYIIL